VVATDGSEWKLEVESVVERHAVLEARTVRWAIEDLRERHPVASFDRPPKPSTDNARRIEFLVRTTGTISRTSIVLIATACPRSALAA
jgi:hypothetical protein